VILNINLLQYYSLHFFWQHILSNDKLPTPQQVYLLKRISVNKILIIIYLDYIILLSLLSKEFLEFTEAFVFIFPFLKSLLSISWGKFVPD